MPRPLGLNRYSFNTLLPLATFPPLGGAGGLRPPAAG
ncbi:MAG: hypothetical protein B193_0003, partial [Solidesulfovibrio magneticus str. Maddingley MBC34]